MDELTLIYTLCGSEEEADRMCHALIEEKLAACANRLSPCLSYFEYNGQMQTKDEFPILFKTTILAAHRATKRIEELHSYETPAIVSWNGDCHSSAFGAWAVAQTK